MHKILEDIVKRKYKDVVQAKREVPISQLQLNELPYKSTFYDAFQAISDTAIITEIKLASPTHTTLGNSSEILERARIYEEAGATALSFITEQHYFKSSTDYLPSLKAASHIPILQKDFVIDDYQIHEAKAIGSDALLLIARLVDSKTLRRFVMLAQTLGVEPIVEVYNAEDLQHALATSTRCIAVNARNLETFVIDINTACQLISHIPKKYLRLAFSGVTTAEDVHKYKASGADAILVGTSLMQATDIKGKIKELRS